MQSVWIQVLLLQGLSRGALWAFRLLAFAATSQRSRKELAELADEKLFVTYVDGDPVAFEVLFDRYGPAMLAYLQRQIFRRDEANDVLQDIFLQLHRCRKDYDPSRTFRPWLYTIAVNILREHFRRIGRRREVLQDEAESIPSTESSPEAAATSQQVRNAVSTLPPDQREAVSLHWFEGFTFPEIATMVGASVSAVKVRAHRGYRSLEEVLA